MENLSHTVLNKKYSNGSSLGSNGFVSGKTVYDDVFGGPPKFGGVRTFTPRVEDYNEIFGGFHASKSSSTIPVLDLPVVNDETEVCFDVQSLNFNYSEVFGGFDFDFSCDELFNHAKIGDFAASFQEKGKKAWYKDPTETEAISATSAPSTNSGRSQSLSNGDQSFEDINQSINSHREANQTSMDSTPSETNSTLSPILPGFVFVIDKIAPSHIMEDKNTLSQVTADININSDFIEMDLGVKQFRKTMSHLPNNVVAIQTIEKGITKPVRKYSQNGSHHNEPFLTVSDINLRTDPSVLPPPLRPPPIRKIDSGEDLGYCSPPYFDVEVDASSSATASAAAMKQVMEQAQAKLRSAKELMERKKEGLQNRSKLGSKIEFKDKKVKIIKLVDGSNSLKDERVQAHEENNKIKVPYFVEGDRYFDVVEKSLVQQNGKESSSSQEFYKTDVAGEWKEANDFFELVKTDTYRKAVDQANNGPLHVQYKEFQGQPRKEKNIALEACEFVDNRKQVLEKSQRKEKDKLIVNVATEITTQRDERNKLEVTRDHKETKKNIASADLWGCDGLLINGHPEENYIEFEETMYLENKHRLKGSNDRKLNGKRLHGTFERDEDKIEFREAFQEVESEENSNQNVEKDESEKRVREVRQQEEHEKNVKEAQQRVEHERRVFETLEHREKEKRLKEDIERKAYENKQTEAREREDIEKKRREDFELQENEKKLKETLEKEVNERKQKESRDREEPEKGQRDTLERQEVDKRLRETCKREEHENGLDEALKIPEREKTAAELMNSGHDTAEIIEKNVIQEAHEGTMTYFIEKIFSNTDQGPCVQTKTDILNKFDKACKLDETITQKGKDAVKHGGSKPVNVEVTIEISAEELGEKISTGAKDAESEALKKNVPVDGRFEAHGMIQGDLPDKEVQSDKKELRSVPRDQNLSGEATIFSGQTRYGENIEKSQKSFDLEDMDDYLIDEFGKKWKNNVQEEVSYNRGVNENEFSSTQMRNKGNENNNNNKTGTAASRISEGQSKAKKIAQEVNTRQSLETKEKNVSGHHKLEKIKKYERMKEDDMLKEEDRLQKLNEERERDREREKDRMAVEKATREVLERAYAESRERAERAALEKSTAEVRQRALTEARERLEKACAEVREKSLAEKSSTEARIRTERAAVERATAEARGRASEKAMADRAAFEARERAKKSASSDSRFPHSGTFSGVEVESAQRCKARLERHQRTAERAAKALAEKNNQDLLAQREQTERNKLSESLDADVKRWSSGKEGNLRALLSTLQYILGPESGWQPIPLMDVITADGVKKAYRKATLCVHPDKLQQRRASIQQKYICEKVFDLLKEAWNKFNSEER